MFCLKKQSMFSFFWAHSNLQKTPYLGKNIFMVNGVEAIEPIVHVIARGFNTAMGKSGPFVDQLPLFLPKNCDFAICHSCHSYVKLPRGESTIKTKGIKATPRRPVLFV